MKTRKILFAVLLTTYGVMWTGGILHYVIFGRPPLNAPWTASLFLLLAGLLILVTTPLRDWMWLVGGAALGFIAELIGVHYGFLFSPYLYTQVLWPHLWGVPLVMYCAWLALLAYAWQLVARTALPLWGGALCSAIWMTAIDLVIDPLAAGRLGYWRWASAGRYYGIPWRNFVGWFVVSAVIFLILRPQLAENGWTPRVGLSIVLFFTAIAFALGLLWPGIIGVGLCAAHAALTMRSQWTLSRRARG